MKTLNYLLPLVALLGVQTAMAADRAASSCNLADVSAAYSAASDGDRIVIPAGSCSWGSALTITKSVQVLGQGVGNTNVSGGQFTVNVPDGKAWRVSGMTITGVGGFNVIGGSKSGRIDHIAFNSVTGFTENRIIWINPTPGDYSAGLIDHISVTDPKSINIHVREEWGGGNNSYARPLGLGGVDAWYVEDSSFSQNTTSYNVSAPVTDCDGGGRIVFRYNTIDNNYTEMHDAIIGGLRSCRKWEIYNNTWTTTASRLSSTGQYAQIAIRGGNGVVFNNTFAASSSFDIIFSNYRSGGQTGGSPWGQTCQSSGTAKACLGTSGKMPTSCSTDSDCGGAAGSCAKIDGSSSSTLLGYPCRDQLGTDGGGAQTVRPALFWNNRIGSTLVAPTQEDYSDRRYLVEGRDYCIGPTTSPGDDGVQPTTCGGVSVPYAPLAYPHPLQSGTVTVIPLLPPLNVFVR
jgi:hypothetical protein